MLGKPLGKARRQCPSFADSPPPTLPPLAGRRDRRLAGIELATPEPATQEPRIIKGEPVGALPEEEAKKILDTYVALLEGRIPTCGGALIGASTVLTGKLRPCRFAACDHASAWWLPLRASPTASWILHSGWRPHVHQGPQPRATPCV